VHRTGATSITSEFFTHTSRRPVHIADRKIWSIWEAITSDAVALYYFSYNLVKIHRSLRVTPAMAAGVTDRVLEVSDLVAMLEAQERGLERAA